MKTKHYTQDSLVIQWAYLFEDVRPFKTSTCAVFWRSVVLTPCKILVPALIVGLFTLAAFLAISNYVANGWVYATLPAWMYIPPPQTTRSPFPWTTVGLVLLAAIGHVLGVWSWLLHGLCLPVEIEGGLVTRGSCPQCVGSMIEQSPTLWVCRKCAGTFVPSAGGCDQAGA